MTDKLKILSQGETGALILQALEDVIGKVADIRYSLPVKSEIQNEVRVAVIKLLSEELVDKLKTLRGERVGNDPHEHE